MVITEVDVAEKVIKIIEGNLGYINMLRRYPKAARRERIRKKWMKRFDRPIQVYWVNKDG